MNFREKEKQVLDQILGPGRYDARIRPSGINGTGEGQTQPLPGNGSKFWDTFPELMSLPDITELLRHE